MLNQTVLTGNLGADPEVFYSSEGNPVANFNLAFRSSKKKTGWIKVVCFGRLAEVSEKYLHKGARIFFCVKIFVKETLALFQMAFATERPEVEFLQFRHST
jgi:single stranded DNA-binding protein